jgi:DNA-damage-inducible protein D
MAGDMVTRLHPRFEEMVHIQEGIEFWYARDLQGLLGYSEWRNFLKVIEKAREACKNAKHEIFDHFVDVNKMVPLGSGSERQIEDIKLTRYACYLLESKLFSLHQPNHG